MAANAVTLATIKNLTLLWFAVLGGAVAWTVRLVGSYIIIALGCELEVIGPLVLGLSLPEMLVVLLTSATALVSAVAAWVAWRIWRRTRSGAFDEAGGRGGRSGFLAVSGLLLNILFVMVILMEGSSVFVLGVCDGAGFRPL